MDFPSDTGSLLDVVKIGFGDDLRLSATCGADHGDLRLTAVPDPSMWATLLATLVWLLRRLQIVMH